MRAIAMIAAVLTCALSGAAWGLPQGDYPLAALPLSGTETVFGLQAGASVNIPIPALGSISLTPAGSDGQVQFNNAGALGAFTLSGDCSLTQPTITCTKSGGTNFGPFATQTNAANLTGTAPSSILPVPSSSTLGGVRSYASVSHQWINTISTSGIPSSSQPACADISNAGTSCTVNTGTSGATLPVLNAANFWSSKQTFNNGVQVTPPSGTLTQGVLSQTVTPSTGSSAGPLLLNEFDCNSNYHTTGADNRTACALIQFNNGGANDIGRKVGLFVNGNHNVASSTTQDHQAISAQEYTNVADTSGGNEYALAGSVVADSGANTLAIVGAELDDTILAGATVPARFGARAVNNGTLQASGTDDTAFAVSSAQSTGQYKHFLLETNFMGFAGLTTTSDWFASDITETVANFANLPNETVTNWIMRFPNWTVTGNGDEILNSINTNAATRTTQIGAGTTSGTVTIGGSANAVVLNGLTTQVNGGVQLNKSQGGSTTEIGNGTTSGQISIGGGSNTIAVGSPVTGSALAVNKNASTNTTEIADGSTTGQITIGGSASQVVLIQGTTRAQGSSTNDNAAAGYYGEYTESSIAVGSAVSLSTGASKTVTSISLTAGDWEVCGDLALTQGGSTVLTVWAGGISLVTNTLPTPPNGGAYFNSYFPSTAGLNPANPVGCMRQSLSGTTTVYLVTQATFSTSTAAVYGDIWARRTR